jgi:hypothetical protein
MQWLRTVRNGGKFYWKPKSTTGCSAREEEEEEEEEEESLLKIVKRQGDTDSEKRWCGENVLELNIHKTKIITFTGKANSIHTLHIFICKV